MKNETGKKIPKYAEEKLDFIRPYVCDYDENGYAIINYEYQLKKPYCVDCGTYFTEETLKDCLQSIKRAVKIPVDEWEELFA